MKNSTVLFLTSMVVIFIQSLLFHGDKTMMSVVIVEWAVLYGAGFICKTIEEN